MVSLPSAPDSKPSLTGLPCSSCKVNTAFLRGVLESSSTLVRTTLPRLIVFVFTNRVGLDWFATIVNFTGVVSNS